MTENHFAGVSVTENMKKERWHKPEDLTCFDCPHRKQCIFVDDWYNIDGDCLIHK